MKGEEAHCYSRKELRNERALRKVEIKGENGFAGVPDFCYFFPRYFSSKTKAEIRVANISLALGKHSNRIFTRDIPK